MKGWDEQLNMSFLPCALMPCLWTFMDESGISWCSLGPEKVAVKPHISKSCPRVVLIETSLCFMEGKPARVAGLSLMPAYSPNEEISLQGEQECLCYLHPPDMCLLGQYELTGGCWNLNGTEQHHSTNALDVKTKDLKVHKRWGYQSPHVTPIPCLMLQRVFSVLPCLCLTYFEVLLLTCQC